MWVLIVFYFLMIIFEGTVALLPLSLCLLLIISITLRGYQAFLLAFIGGILLDIFSLRSVGITSSIFLGLLFLLFLYQKKYEITSVPFVFAASFFTSLIYLILLHQTHIFFRSFVAAGITFFIYVIYKRVAPARIVSSS